MHPLTVLFETDPKAAVKAVAESYLKASCEITATAEDLDISRFTLHGWIRSWDGLGKALAEARSAYAKRELERFKTQRTGLRR